MSSRSACSGSRRTLELCWRSTVGPFGRGQGSQESVEEFATLMSGEKTGFTWQKCSLRLRECGSDDRFSLINFF